MKMKQDFGTLKQKRERFVLQIVVLHENNFVFI